MNEIINVEVDERSLRRMKREELLKNAPKWVVDVNCINEVAFCKDFVSRNPMICVNGRMYDFEGAIEDDQLVSMISQEIIRYVFKGLAKTTRTIMDALKIYCYAPELPLSEKEIHLKNGTYSTELGYFQEKKYCRSRLGVEYRRFDEEDCCPENFLAFLHELLEEEDIVTLQEYLGYCLIPGTRGQTAMFIVGNGGEGKSRIGVVLKEIFGKAMISAKFQRIENDRFFPAQLVNKLLMIDEDMQMEPLASTGMFKTIVSAEGEIEVEEKGKQGYSAKIYSRILCFGNGSPRSLYDRSNGFIRRLIILTTKPKNPDRTDDPFIAERFIAEKDRIFRWMLDGLFRLMGNGFRFTLSEKTKENVRQAVADGCNIGEFIEENCYTELGSDFKATGVELYCVYDRWCRENALEPVKRTTFITWLRRNGESLGITYSNNIPDENKRHVRGFKGVRVTIKTHI